MSEGTARLRRKMSAQWQHEADGRTGKDGRRENPPFVLTNGGFSHPMCRKRPKPSVAHPRLTPVLAVTFAMLRSLCPLPPAPDKNPSRVSAVNPMDCLASVGAEAPPLVGATPLLGRRLRGAAQALHPLSRPVGLPCGRPSQAYACAGYSPAGSPLRRCPRA